MVLQKLRSWAAAPFEFSSVPVTTLAVLLYGVIFALVLHTDQLFDVPKNTKGLDLDRAYANLHQITARPHPFLSHANDDVHAYLLSQLEPVASAYAHVHISDDLTSNASWVINDRGVYFEGTNILVKIDGTDTPLSDPDSKPNGILFSVHYDSVSTAPGATDDGMGVVTLLELVRYFAIPEHRPRRTAVFFFNNGEEDTLNGAYVYWKHPWSNLTSSFINLEGAASGGRPLLFRSTSLAPTRAFTSSAIAHLQADVLTADAFKSGVIRSSTDYQIYAAGLKGQIEPMSGVDVAFYKNRAFYHTPRDSIPGMGYGEGRKALWAMMESARGAGLSLLNDDDTTDDNREPGVYFDLFKTKLILFSLGALFVTNVILLVIGPIITTILLVTIFIASRKSAQERAVEDQIQSGRWTRTKKALGVILGWGRFWVALIVDVAAHVGLVAGFVKINPYVVHAHPYLVLVTFMSLSFLAITAPLQLLQYFLPSSPSAQKLAVLLEHYFLTWVALVGATVEMQKYQIGGLYWVTIWNICAFVSTGVTLVEGTTRVIKSGKDGRKAGLDLTVDAEYDGTNGSGPRLVSGVLYEAPTQRDGDERDEEQGVEEEGEVIETEPTEITPLMQQHRPDDHGSAGDSKYQEYGWWILQMAVSIPLFALLIFQVELLQLQALMNTLVDGSSPVTLYGFLSILSMLIFIPAAPFAHKLHHCLTLAVAVIFALSLTASWVAFPFAQDRPFKVFFQQQVELDATLGPLADGQALAVNSVQSSLIDTEQAQTGSLVRVVTTLTGLRGYVDRRIVPEMPSSWGKDVHCYEDTILKPGLYTCGWESNLLPMPGGDGDDGDVDWLDVKTTRLNATSAIMYLKGTNTRGCRLYFDKPINYYAIHDMEEGDTPSTNTTGQFLPGYEMPAQGVKEVRLWTRNWGQPFLVEFGWEGKSDDESSAVMTGRAACEWAEYASASAGGSSPVAFSGLIPAFEEVQAFLPLWALPSKSTDGLVEAWRRFQI